MGHAQLLHAVRAEVKPKTMATTLRPKAQGRYLVLFAAVLTTLLFLAAVRWMLEHPYAIHSDEAWYVNEAQIDLQAFHAGGLVQLGRWIIHGDSSRPPAYRLMVFPFLALFGYHTLTARLVTLTCFLFSAWLTYLTTRRLAGAGAGAIAVLVFVLSPEILQASITFATEGPLYLAIAGMFYFLSVYWSDAAEPFGNWIGLGLAIGLGSWSKTTFAFIAVPVLLFSAVIAWRNRGLSSVIALVKAGLLGLLVAAPWWRANFLDALAYAKYASRGFPRHSLGPHSLTTWAQWLGNVFVSLIGPAIGILIGLIVMAYVRGDISKKEALSPLQRNALIACACAALPLVFVQLSGTNYLLRHVSPVIVPLAIAIGVLLDATSWARSNISVAVLGLLFSSQFLMLVFPVLAPNKHPVDFGSINGFPWRIMSRFEQWDWKPLEDISNSCGIASPKISFVNQGRALNGNIQYGWGNPTDVPRISYLGNGRAFNGSQIQYPWLAQGLAFPDVTWLWRYESGPIVWQGVLRSAEQSDLVLTAPNYVGEIPDRENLDNQYNSQFAAMLGQDPHFRGPIRLELGQLDPVEVDVFVKSSLACH
jgi:4-amino-4-deoxy-L-arabinose transferase-like glycosyltransferase